MQASQIKATLAVTAAALAVLVPGVACAQEESGGLVTRFEITQSLRSHSNLRLEEDPAGSTLRADTAFRFGLSSETRRDRLSFDLGFVLRAEDDPSPESTSGLVDPSLAFAYVREVGLNRLTLTFDAARSELDGTNLIFDPDLGGFSLITDTGTRLSYGFGALLELGTEGPFGFDIDLRSRSNDFSDTTNPGLFDRRTDSVELRTRLAFSPVLTGTGKLFLSRFSTDDVETQDRDTTALTLGLTYRLDPVTELSATLGGRRIVEEGQDTQESVEGSLRWQREFSRGLFGVELGRELTAGGKLTRMGIDRRFDFRTGTLALELGAVKVENDDTYPAVSLVYTQTLPRGSLALSVGGDVNVNIDGDAQQVLRAGLDYTRQLTALSQVSVGVDFIDLDNVGNTSLTDSRTAEINATYSHSLTRDWQLSLGAAHRISDEEGVERRDNSVFVSLGRSLEFRR